MLNNTHAPNEIPTICPAVNFSTFLGDVETGDAETGDVETGDTVGVTGDTGDEGGVTSGVNGVPGDDNKLEGLVKI